MKSFIALLIAFAIIFQSAGKLIIIVHYSLNKEYISKNLCENRAKPKMHCNGKCHLKKELQKEDKKDNSPSNNLKEKYEVQFFEKFKKIINILPFSEREKATTTYLFPFSSEDLSAIFHPPQS